MIETGRRAPAPDFYDNALDDPTNDLHKTCFETSYAPLYEAAVALVPKHQSITEIGSGTGQFAYLLWLSWPDPPMPYEGIDFSARSVEIARDRFPMVSFSCADVTTSVLPPSDTYVSLATLEHIDDDLAVIAQMPEGSYVILSAPSFDAVDHVRFAPTPSSALRRYEDVIAIEHWQRLTLNEEGDFIHLFAGRRA